MKLKEILKNIDYKLIKGNLNIDIFDIKYDSREIKQNDLFIALPGIDVDGHNYINQAIKNGAKAIVVCKDVEIESDITVIKVDNTRTKLSYLSANFFGNPSDNLIKIAITGTKGKTSISWMLKNILETAGYKVGVIGTIGTFINNQLYEHKNTTPESYHVQKFMRKMVDEGVTHLIMEASSQALMVGRINNIIFDYAIFTNLSNDHIGPREHKDYNEYVYAKSLLFKQAKIGIINVDDLEKDKIIKDATCKIYTYGTNKADLEINDIKLTNTSKFLGTTFTTNGLSNRNYKVSAPGIFSAYNAASAILTSKLLNINETTINNGLKTFKVRGRCVIINVNNKFKVIIDFAHNKLSIESILNMAKSYNPNRIITIFGCGGGRSKEIRQELGEVTSSLTDLNIITCDNPRNDNLDEINQDIITGIKKNNGEYKIIKDRKEAIIYSLDNAKKNDIILLLGKGHETYQEIKGKKYYFNEIEIIKEWIDTHA